MAGEPVPVPAPAKPVRASAPGRALDRSWPAAGDVSLTLTAATPAKATQQRAGALAVLLTNASRSAQSVTVHVAARAAATAAGVSGILVGVTPVRTSASGSAVVTIDYSGFADAGGAGYGSRLTLVAMPACALSTPSVPACQAQKPISSINDPAIRAVRTKVGVPLWMPVVIAAVPSAAGPNGDFSVSSLAPSSSWPAAGSTGAFNWSYPIAVPPAAAGAEVAPSVALSYSSSSVDGRIARSNNQSSWIGEGWDYNPGYIERTYRTCSDTASVGDPSYTGDQCWAGQVMTMNLGGSTTSLVVDDTTGEWHPQNDQGQQVEHLTGTTNGALNGEYWKVTALNGISYYFGRDILPGGTTATATNSTLTEPVYAAHAGDPCYNPTFALSKCTQAWRWNLDYVVDPHGNATAYHYVKETNNYGAAGRVTAVSYDRAATLSYIDYGLREVSGSIAAHPATDRVSFTTTQRCVPVAGFACNATDFTAANASHWPDTPQDQQCAAAPAVCNDHSPTFWSTQRLTRIQTGYYNGSGYTPVDQYDLAQSFPAMGNAELELDSISHIGYSAAGVASAPQTVRFTSQLLPNRVPNTNSQPAMAFWRLNQISSETGTYTVVAYGQPNGQGCTASTLPADPAANSRLCFPVKWTPTAGSSAILDYYQKYVVTQVQVVPHDGRSPTQVTSYTYLGAPAWHADDNEVVKPAERSYG